MLSEHIVYAGHFPKYFYILVNSITTQILWCRYYYPHLTSKNEEGREYITCPRASGQMDLKSSISI